MEFWNDVTALKGISHGFMWAAISFAILAAVSTGLRFYVDRRASELSSMTQKEREATMRAEIDAAHARLRGRHLSPEQVTAITNAARPHCGTLGTVHVTAANSNNEAQIYGSEIVNALKAAGCTAELSLPIPGLRPDIVGLHIAVKPSQTPPLGAQELGGILAAAGIKFTTSKMNDDFFQGVPYLIAVGASP